MSTLADRVRGTHLLRANRTLAGVPGLKPRLLITVRTGTDRMRKRFRQWLWHTGCDATRLDFVDADDDVDPWHRRWGFETAFEVVGSYETMLAAEGEAWWVGAELAVNVRPPAGYAKSWCSGAGEVNKKKTCPHPLYGGNRPLFVEHPDYRRDELNRVL